MEVPIRIPVKREQFPIKEIAKCFSKPDREQQILFCVRGVWCLLKFQFGLPLFGKPQTMEAYLYCNVRYNTILRNPFDTVYATGGSHAFYHVTIGSKAIAAWTFIVYKRITIKIEYSDISKIQYEYTPSNQPPA